MNLPYQTKMLNSGLILIYTDNLGHYYFNNRKFTPRFVNSIVLANLITSGKIS